MFKRLPSLAYLLGAAGLIPFIGCALVAVTKGEWQATGMFALLAYGAVILGFLGGVHWGFALAPGDQGSQRARLAWGIAPSLVGWAALLLAQTASPELGLALLVVGLLGTVAIEVRWARRDLMPSGYMALRWALSVVVLLTLVTVMGLRLIGATIIF
jgi:hypothetical protein